MDSAIDWTTSHPITCRKPAEKRKERSPTRDPVKYVKFSDDVALDNNTRVLIGELIQFLYLLNRSNASRHLLNVFMDKIDKLVRSYSFQLRKPI